MKQAKQTYDWSCSVTKNAEYTFEVENDISLITITLTYILYVDMCMHISCTIMYICMYIECLYMYIRIHMYFYLSEILTIVQGP